MFHISSLVSPSFLLPLMSYRLFLQTAQEILFSLHVAGRQKSRNPPARRDTAKNCHEGTLHSLDHQRHLAPQHFSPQYTAAGRTGGRSLLKQPGTGKAQVLREKQMTKSCSIQGSAPRKVNHQCLAILCCGSPRKHTDPLPCLQLCLETKPKKDLF